MMNKVLGCLGLIVLVVIAILLFVLVRNRAEPVVQSQPVMQPVSSNSANASASPAIKIVLPAHGARVRVGQAFQVHVIATDARGVSAIAFAVDGQLGAPIAAPSSPALFATAIPITLQTKGVHTITVLAQNEGGAKSDPVAIKVVAVQSLSEPANPDEPPAPAPIANPVANPGGAAAVSFVASPATIAAGQCSILRWDVENVREVYFEGAGVSGHGEQQQCPAQTTTYSLITILLDGSPRTTTATITVSGNAPQPVAQVPTAPTSLRVTATTKTTARIAWDDKADSETGFEIQVEGGASVRTNANETQYEMAGLTCHRAYNFRVRAVNAAGNSAWSNQVTAQTLACDGGGASFAATSATVSVNRATYSGPCPNTFTAGAKIVANGAGTVRYRWERSDGQMSDTRTLQFDAAGEKTVTNIDWSIGASGNYWMRLHVLEPNDLVSNRGESAWTCTSAQTSFAVTSVSADVEPEIFSGTCPKSINYSGKITTNGAGTVSYRWVRSDGVGETRTLNFSTAGTQTVTSGTVTYNQSATYWAKLEVLAPNAMTSDQAKFTLNCTSPAIVTLASVNINPTAYTGNCPHTFNFNGTIVTNAPGTVTYRWERSDGTGETRTLNFAAASSQTVQSGDFKSGSSGTFWARLHVLTPNDKVSNQAQFVLTCK